METLREIWAVIYPYLAGISVSGILAAIFYACLKGGFSRAINKINVQKIVDDTTTKSVDRIKDVTFTHSIQPLVESEMLKVNEKTTAALKEELASVRDQYNKLLSVIESFAEYFDNSIYVTDEQKAKLKAAVESAKIEPQDTKFIGVVEVAEKKPKVAEKAQKEAEKAIEQPIDVVR